MFMFSFKVEPLLPCIGKDPDAEQDGRQVEKGMTEDELIGWYHHFNGHEFEQTQGNSEGQGSWRAAVHGVAKSQTSHLCLPWPRAGKLENLQLG